MPISADTQFIFQLYCGPENKNLRDIRVMGVVVEVVISVSRNKDFY